MTITAIALVAGVLLATSLCVWAYITGSPGEMVDRPPARPAARHSRAAQQEVTTRLRPAAPDLQALPRREDLPWNQ